MTLFNFVTSKKTKDWFKDHAGKMPLFPTYIALLSNKLFVGFVKLAENYTNQCATKDRVVDNLDMDDLSRAIGTLYITLSRRLKSSLITTSFGLTTQPSFSLLPAPLQRIAPLTDSTSPPGVLGAAVQAAGAALDAATATPAVVVAAAQVVVMVSTPGVPGPVSARAASETPEACVFATTKVVTSSLGVRATPLGPSAPRFESNIVLNTPPTVISVATPAVLSSTDGLTTTQLTSKLSSWPMLRQTRLWSCSLPTVIPR